MFIKNLKLKNIRSYSDLELNFNEGSTLLSGDIGAGKTTILLSVEFALFGFIRGTISGSTLLRHGAKKGSVELTFDIDGKETTILRALKRTSSSIAQDFGYIIHDETKTELSAVELKSKILEILGYPEELLTKSKSLIFRYTVYTPQEEMKLILFEQTEERLEKLRKIFDIDKYKRIKENAAMYAKEMRNIIKTEAILIDDLEEKESEHTDKKIELKNISEEIKKAEAELKTAIENEALHLKESEKQESELKILQELKNKIKISQNQLENFQNNKESIKNQLVETKEELSSIKIEKNELTKDKKKILEEINKYETMLEDTSDKIISAKNRNAVFESKKSDIKLIIDNINNLKLCPTCKQEVTKDHKHLVEAEEKSKIVKLEDKNKPVKEFIEKAEKNRTILKTKITNLRSELIIAEKEEEKLNSVKKQELVKVRLEERIESLNKKILDFLKEEKEKTEELKFLKKEKENITIDENAILQKKKELEIARNKTMNAKINQSRIIQRKEMLEKDIVRLEKEINSRKERQAEIKIKEQEENWLRNHFINIIDVIEKQVMVSIYNEFNERFQEWFNMLIEDETIQASLDETFAPVVNQNGYDTEIDNLSGGEKTSVALAYRLALNKVINDRIGNIKTRDLIILDEPTDGFSSEQLDKVRDVLDQLNCKQTIIVSHEPKMESFVENIIRIRKYEHESEAV